MRGVSCVTAVTLSVLTLRHSMTQEAHGESICSSCRCRQSGDKTVQCGICHRLDLKGPGSDPMDDVGSICLGIEAHDGGSIEFALAAGDQQPVERQRL